MTKTNESALAADLANEIANIAERASNQNSNLYHPQFLRMVRECVTKHFAAQQQEIERLKRWTEEHYDTKKQQWLNSVTLVCADYPNVASYIQQVEQDRNTLAARLADAELQIKSNNEYEELYYRIQSQQQAAIDELALSKVPAAGSLKADEAVSFVSIATTEIKSLRARRAEMEKALDKLARLGNEPHFGNSIGNQIALEALAAVQYTDGHTRPRDVQNVQARNNKNHPLNL